MHRFIPILLGLTLLVPTKVWALTDDLVGISIDGGVGGDFSFPDIDGGLAWEATVGTWFGRYDNAFSIGRNWLIGAGVRQDFPAWTPRTAAVLEVRRNVDILVAGWFFFAEGGPEFVNEEVGGIANLGVGIKGRFRFSGPHVGYRIRLRAGTRIHDTVQGTAGITIGVEWYRPFKNLNKPKEP